MKILKTFFAKRMKEAMYQRRISPKVLADRLDVTEATVSRWTSGIITPSDDRLPKIVKAIGVDVSFFEPVSLEEKEADLLRFYRESDYIGQDSILDTAREIWAASAHSTRGRTKGV